MNQTISIDVKTVQQIVSRLDQLSQDMTEIKEKLLAPKEGSDEWWAVSDKRALASIRRGEGTTIHNKKELNELFKKLEKS